MHACMHVCVHAFICTGQCKYVRRCVYACIHVWMYVCMTVCKRVCMHVSMGLCMDLRKCMGICIHICMQANTHCYTCIVQPYIFIPSVHAFMHAEFSQHRIKKQKNSTYGNLISADTYTHMTGSINIWDINVNICGHTNIYTCIHTLAHIYVCQYTHP